MRALPAIALASLALGSCITTTVEHPIGAGTIVVERAPATRSWTVWHEGQEVGSVIRFQEQTGPRRFLYSVRNEHNQDLGMVDSIGRAWRERPHAEPEWLGTFTVLQGVSMILGMAGEVRLEEVGGARSGDMVAASASR